MRVIWAGLPSRIPFQTTRLCVTRIRRSDWLEQISIRWLEIWAGVYTQTVFPRPLPRPHIARACVSQRKNGLVHETNLSAASKAQGRLDLSSSCFESQALSAVARERRTHVHARDVGVSLVPRPHPQEGEGLVSRLRRRGVCGGMYN